MGSCLGVSVGVKVIVFHGKNETGRLGGRGANIGGES